MFLRFAKYVKASYLRSLEFRKAYFIKSSIFESSEFRLTLNKHRITSINVELDWIGEGGIGSKRKREDILKRLYSLPPPQSSRLDVKNSAQRLPH